MVCVAGDGHVNFSTTFSCLSRQRSLSRVHLLLIVKDGPESTFLQEFPLLHGAFLSGGISQTFRKEN